MMKVLVNNTNYNKTMNNEPDMNVVPEPKRRGPKKNHNLKRTITLDAATMIPTGPGRPKYNAKLVKVVVARDVTPETYVHGQTPVYEQFEVEIKPNEKPAVPVNTVNVNVIQPEQPQPEPVEVVANNAPVEVEIP